MSLLGELGFRQRQVYDILCRYINGLTRKEIAEKLNLPINSITGRVKELLNNDRIVEDGCRPNPNTFKTAMVLKIK